MTVGYTVEQEWHRPNGTAAYLVRVDGGRRLQVVIPARFVRGDDIAAIIAGAIDRMAPPLGPNTKAGIDE